VALQAFRRPFRLLGGLQEAFKAFRRAFRRSFRLSSGLSGLQEAFIEACEAIIDRYPKDPEELLRNMVPLPIQLFPKCFLCFGAEVLFMFKKVF